MGPAGRSPIVARHRCAQLESAGVGSPECAAPRTATGDQPGGGREGGRETCEMHQRESESAAWQEMLIGLSYGALAPEKESGK